MMDDVTAPSRAFLGIAVACLLPMLAPALALVLAGCSPTLKVEAPDKPIEINLNIKIEQEVRIKVERDLEKVFTEDPELFGIPGGGAAK